MATRALLLPSKTTSMCPRAMSRGRTSSRRWGRILFAASDAAWWRDQRVPAEAIPRLMKEMEGSLEESDYEVMLHNKFLVGTLVLFAILPVSVVVVITREMVLDPWGIPPAFGVPLMLGFCGFLGWFSHRIYFRKMSRRRRQQGWIRSRV